MAQSVNPEMLILARESRGFTQSDLAKAALISQGNISKYESGLLYVSNEHLQRIASVLAYPEAFFFLMEECYTFGSSCTYHRKRQTMPVHELKMLLARSNILRIHVNRLLRGVDIEAENVFPRFDIADFEGNVEEIARLVRQTWHLPFGPISNLVRAIEDAGGVVYQSSFGTRKLDAISQWMPNLHPGSPPVFLVNTDMSGERIRFTLSHELGHLIMHRVPTDNMEEEADRFAAEFLMPVEDIGPDLRSITLANLVKLKPYWKVSIQALVRRAKDLEKITPRQYRALNEQLSKQGYRINEPYPLPIETPTVLREIFEVYGTEHGYSLSELSDLLLLHENETKEKYLSDHRRLRIVGTG